MYEILTGPRKGEFIVKPQVKSTMQRLIEKGIVREVKEEKQEPETKELKQEIETKEVKRRGRVPNKRKN